MKRSKREANGIIIHFVLYFVVVVGLGIYIYSTLYPKVMLIEEDKTYVKELYSKIKGIEKSGLSFEQFKLLKDNGKTNLVITEILKNMSDSFYTDNLTNTGSESYAEFLDNKSSKLSLVDVQEQNSTISKILPSYSDNSIDFGNEFLTDYRFINYIESLIESFNFTTTNSIGISNIVLIQDFATSKNIGDSLDSNIYFIPLKMVFKGTKSGIIDFLYFIENVGNINIKGDDIFINSNYGFLSKNQQKMVLEGDKYSSNYNILEHQIADISRITMSEYIDSSYTPRGEKDFKAFIKDTQGNDEYEVSMDLMFYVKGQPAYKIEEYVTGVIKKHKEAQGFVNMRLQRTDLNGIERINLTKDKDSLNALSEDIISLNKGLVKKENLEETYKISLKLDLIIDPIHKNLQK